MTYDLQLAEKIRNHLSGIPGLKVEEKKMFRGLCFMVNEKMCVNVSGENMMCRFDPELLEIVAERNGFEPMIMKGKQLSGYCYVNAVGYRSKKDFDYWMRLCLDFNKIAKASKKS